MPRSARPPWRAGSVGARRGPLGLLAVLLFALWATAMPGTAHAAVDADAQLLVVGVTGVNWADVTPERTPAMWELAQEASVGSLVVRAVRGHTCPADGWLTFAAGARAADQPGPCRALLDPWNDTAPGWDTFIAQASGDGFGTRLGALGEAARASGEAVAGIGPGAAIALADGTGVVQGAHSPRADAGSALTAQVAAALASASLVVVDAGSVRDASPPAAAPPGWADTPSRLTSRASQLAQLDARVGDVLAALDARAEDSGDGARAPTVLLASLADSGTAPGLRILMSTSPDGAAGTADGAPGLLTSSSTRHPGYSQTTDLLPSVIATLGWGDRAATSSLVGSAPVLSPAPAEALERIAAVRDHEVRAQVIRPLVAPFYLILVVLNIALYAVVAVGLKRPAATRLRARLHARRARRTGPIALVPLAEHRPRVLHGLRVVALALACLPAAALLANLVPWWRSGAPALAVAWVIAAWVAAITALALARPWSRTTFGGPTVVAAVTATVLTVDVATGSTLQLAGVLAGNPLVGGRFYGFHNTTFALFAVATIVCAMTVAGALVLRRRRRSAAVVVAVIGAAATFVNGAPHLGADFGGPPGLVAGFAVLTLMAAGVRLTWRRAVGVLGAGVAVTVSFAVLDWLRPADDRTHLGRFIETVLAGGMLDVVVRKAEANLRVLASNRPLTLLAVTGVLLVVGVLARPLRVAITSPGGGTFDWLTSGAPISQMGQDAPMLRPGLIAIAFALGVGFVLNDSGIAIPAMGVALAVPLLLAACAAWMLGRADAQSE